MDIMKWVGENHWILWVGGVAIGGAALYGLTHRKSSSTTTTTTNPSDYYLPTVSSDFGYGNSYGGYGGGGSGGGSGSSSSNGTNIANPYPGTISGGAAPGSDSPQPTTGSGDNTLSPSPLPVAAPSPLPVSSPVVAPSPFTFTPPPTISAPAPAPAPAPIMGLSDVNYSPTPNTPNQVTVGSANGLTQIALPVGETLNTPVVVPNSSAGNPVVPLSDLISTGSANTLSSAYGTAATAAVAQQYITYNPKPAPVVTKTPAPATKVVTGSTVAKTLTPTQAQTVANVQGHAISPYAVK